MEKFLLLVLTNKYIFTRRSQEFVVGVLVIVLAVQCSWCCKCFNVNSKGKSQTFGKTEFFEKRKGFFQSPNSGCADTLKCQK